MRLSILFPTDGSPAALAAAAWINTHWARDEALVTVLHVLNPVWEGDGLAEHEAARRHGADVLTQTADQLDHVHVHQTLSIIGTPPEAIVRCAVDQGADLIVMGHSFSPTRGGWLTSVSFAVFERSPVPVTIVQSKEP